jgi:hypothetical protein
MPAKAGIQRSPGGGFAICYRRLMILWTPAFAGVTWLDGRLAGQLTRPAARPMAKSRSGRPFLKPFGIVNSPARS